MDLGGAALHGEPFRAPSLRAPRCYCGFSAEGLVHGEVVLAEVAFAHETDGRYQYSSQAVAANLELGVLF
jgi:hypothetical protein